MRLVSRALFPLRSNSKSLLAGAPVASTIRRIKLASLLYDLVIIEDGYYELLAGEEYGRSELYPLGREPRTTWQTPRDRAAIVERGLHPSYKPKGSPDGGPEHFSFSFEAEVAWQATFIPLKNDVSRLPWVEFADFTGARDKRHWTEFFTMDGFHYDGSASLSAAAKHFVYDHLRQDLATAAEIGAVLGADKFHSGAIPDLVRAGECEDIPSGEAVLEVVMPRVGDLAWNDLEVVRNMPGIRSYRAILNEIEEEARSNATSSLGFRQTIQEHYAAHLSAAASDLLGDWRSRAARSVLTCSFGQVLAQVATGPVGTIGSIALELLPGDGRHNWVSVDEKLREFASGGRS